MMKLYSGPLSLFSRKVEITLREKGLAFDRILVPFTQEKGYAPKHPEVLVANPKGQVPVLVDGDLTLFDSTIILEYLEDAYPEPRLFPADPRTRARCRLVELTADEILFAQVRPLLHRTEPPDPERRERQEAEARAEAALLEAYAGLEHNLRQPYFFGDYSVADIAMFMTVLFALRLRGPSLDGFPKLAAWHARIRARPAVATVAEEIAAADRELSYLGP